MAIKIIDCVLLSEGQTGLELTQWLTDADHAELREWVEQMGFTKYIEVKNFYRAEFMGDVDYPAIQVKKGAPKQVKTMCLLKWS